ncbi:MAG: hypothetical protein MJ003_05580 [Paludibacteraceae bacterium]|nr:hypothetical protein [Paludibacteraceae bacterium]
MKTLRFISIALAGALICAMACKNNNGNEPSPIPEPTPTGEKCKASDYPQVTIGTQVWMAENYRCSKYDTQSEAFNASWLKDNTIPTYDGYSYTPYYTDASDKSKWETSEYAGNLTDAQVAKLGYLYNWAAAVGVADGEEQTTSFVGNRQGICPNGWHIPSIAEWQAFYDYIYNDMRLTSNTVGKYLKTISGWYSGGSGLDTYGFVSLPAGYATGSGVNHVGGGSSFCTATPSGSGSGAAYSCNLGYDLDGLFVGSGINPSGRSVRCLRN